MSTNRVEFVERAFDEWLDSAAQASALLAPDAPLCAGSQLGARMAVELFEDQVASRALDIASRELKKSNRSFYTISSAGHENNAVLGALLRATDPCFLHYRSGGLMQARSRKLSGGTPVFDTLLSLVASAEDPASGGRHKVWGSRPLWVPPQTSTIASHLPKAVGLAISLARARRLGIEIELPNDSVVCCTFGDASANHCTALAGFNFARYAARQGSPCPVLFVCEDNGIGISVPTPQDWIRESFGALPHLRYFRAAGELDQVHDAALEAIEWCRATRRPAFLHLETTRLWGHAGSDVETTYHNLAQIEALEARDPLLRNAKRLVACGAATPSQLRSLVRDTRERVNAASEEAARRPRLVTRESVVASLGRWDESAVRAHARVGVDLERRRAHFGTLPEQQTSATKKTLAAHVNSTLHDEFLRRPEVLLFGEDAGKKGGVYGITAELQKRFGVARCFDTLLDETSILGLAQGAAHIGLLPLPEIQYLAYIHNALDQLRGEACSLQFFSNGQFANPMVVRVQGLAYQKGFGGHFHNDNSLAALRDIPALMLAVPARGDDAARMLRGAVAAAKACQRVVVFLEPIALYHERDLYEDGDNQWLFAYPPPESDVLLPGDVGVYHEDARDLLIVSYANGLRLSLRAAKVLAERHGIRARVVDLRWLNPLPFEALARHAAACKGVLVADECRRTGGGIAEAVLADLAERGVGGKLRSVRAADTYVPLGSATSVVLLQEHEIVDAARRMA
ncbi:MAG: MFS transporter [Planctomycetes bacterium]|nr:MFS transporter [Planctomycetota bacterium]